MRAEVTITVKSGQYTDELTQAVTELVEELVFRKCTRINCRGLPGSYTVAFDLEDVPELSMKELKEAVNEFRDDGGLTCKLHTRPSYRLPEDCQTAKPSGFRTFVDRIRIWFGY